MAGKYAAFTEEGPFLKHVAGRSGMKRSYVEVSCPHCNVMFLDLAVEQLTSSKASKCKRHLDSGCTWTSVRGPRVEDDTEEHTQVVAVPNDELTNRISEMQKTLEKIEPLELDCKELRTENKHLCETVGSLRVQLNTVEHELSLSKSDNSTLGARVTDLEHKVGDYKALMCKVGDLHGLERPYDRESFMGKLMPMLMLHDRRFEEQKTVTSTASESERLRNENRRLKAELKDVNEELSGFKYHNPRLRKRADDLHVENERLKKRMRSPDALEAAEMMQGLIKLARDGSSGIRTFLLSAVHSDKQPDANKELAAVLRDYVCKHVPKK